MNTLSLFIYLASIMNKVEAFFITFGTIGILIGFIVTAISLTEKIEYLKKYGKILLIMGFTFLPLGVLIPDRDSIYLILASEAGEELARTETAKKVYEVLNKRLDEMLENGRIKGELK